MVWPFRMFEAAIVGHGWLLDRNEPNLFSKVLMKAAHRN
jgi:hypothetical protein